MKEFKQNWVNAPLNFYRGQSLWLDVGQIGAKKVYMPSGNTITFLSEEEANCYMFCRQKIKMHKDFENLTEEECMEIKQEMEEIRKDRDAKLTQLLKAYCSLEEPLLLLYNKLCRVWREVDVANVVANINPMILKGNLENFEKLFEAYLSDKSFRDNISKIYILKKSLCAKAVQQEGVQANKEETLEEREDIEDE